MRRRRLIIDRHEWLDSFVDYFKIGIKFSAVELVVSFVFVVIRGILKLIPSELLDKLPAILLLPVIIVLILGLFVLSISLQGYFANKLWGWR